MNSTPDELTGETTKLPRATPALPIAVIGERIADLILEPRSG
jgi:hypothetical protein